MAVVAVVCSFSFQAGLAPGWRLWLRFKLKVCSSRCCALLPERLGFDSLAYRATTIQNTPFPPRVAERQVQSGMALGTLNPADAPPPVLELRGWDLWSRTILFFPHFEAAEDAPKPQTTEAFSSVSTPRNAPLSDLVQIRACASGSPTRPLDVPPSRASIPFPFSRHVSSSVLRRELIHSFLIFTLVDPDVNKQQPRKKKPPPAFGILSRKVHGVAEGRGLQTWFSPSAFAAKGSLSLLRKLACFLFPREMNPH
ncbi:hypothetical protein T439DRAFT_348702 [Meredithblackwellia eburnea MCA 4105]